jgi:CheY-like chemotaxis protein
LLQIRMDKGDPLRMYVDHILSAAEKASVLTKSLLTFGRKQPVNLQPTYINIIIKGTKQLLNRLLTEDIVLETRLDPEPLSIMADATQIDQILFNLVSNARDSMPKGGTVIIETQQTFLEKGFTSIHGFGVSGRYVVLSVSDTGMGMNKATKEKIFEPFFTTKETGKGTGLGLATVYGIVKQHNGYVTVYSEPGIGTTFRIYFPAVTGRPEVEPPAFFDLKRGKETILVAEDNEDVRRFTKEVLKMYGYHVIEAVDGVDAVDKFQEAEMVDLLILDTVMPRKNGKEALDEIIKIKPDIKVLFMSGHARDILLDKGIREKEFEFISKPLSPHELLGKLRSMLDA